MQFKQQGDCWKLFIDNNTFSAVSVQETSEMSSKHFSVSILLSEYSDIVTFFLMYMKK